MGEYRTEVGLRECISYQLCHYPIPCCVCDKLHVAGYIIYFTCHHRHRCKIRNTLVSKVSKTNHDMANYPFSVQVKWRNIHFIMWDIGGQESLRQAWSTYYSGTQFVILVVDSTDKERLAVSREELYKMLGNDVSSFRI